MENNKFDSIINNSTSIYKYLMWIIYTIYILLFLGVLSSNFKYLRYFSNTVQLLVCIFLITRFHPFRKHYYTKNDATMIFASALFMLQNIGLTELVIKYGNGLEQNVPFFVKLHKDINALFSYNRNTTTNTPNINKIPTDNILEIDE